MNGATHASSSPLLLRPSHPRTAACSRLRLAAWSRPAQRRTLLRPTATGTQVEEPGTAATAPPPPSQPPGGQQEGASTDLSIIFSRLSTLTAPYWTDGEQAGAARWRLAGVLGLTLGTTGVSVLFNFLGRDFFNALSAKDQAKFTEMLFKWLAALCAGIPVFVLRDYYQSRLALEWREWMTERLTRQYFEGRTFYTVQAEALLDNPDQRIAVDVRSFTDTTLASGVTLLNAAVDLVSFSGILFSIYPPLFLALVLYSVGGTAASLAIGRPLVGLNFAQEAAEANFRYGLVRVRENAESIAFYGGEDNEARLLSRRLKAAVENFGQLLLASRNLNFFTSFYRFLIGILPAAVVAPLFFRGEIEFGVVNQSSSAFNHILSDVSLVVFQFEALAGFSAVIDRLGELDEVLGNCREADAAAAGGCNIAPVDSSAPAPATGTGTGTGTATGTATGTGKGSTASTSTEASDEGSPAVAVGAVGVVKETISLACVSPSASGPLLELESLTLKVPATGTTLVAGLTLSVGAGDSLLIMGPSGAGKTSLLRAVAGLWRSGNGRVVLHGQPMGRAEGSGDIFFVPQRPYVVLGTLRDQLVYPTWSRLGEKESAGEDAAKSGDASAAGSSGNGSALAVAAGDNGNGAAGSARPLPSDDAMRDALRAVQLAPLLARVGGDLGATADWASMLSLGEQQRLAFARVLLAKPRIVLMDESTSALDARNERLLYSALRDAGVACVSVGHRPSLLAYHRHALLLAGDVQGGWELRRSDDVPLEEAAAYAE